MLYDLFSGLRILTGAPVYTCAYARYIHSLIATQAASKNIFNLFSLYY